MGRRETFWRGAYFLCVMVLLGLLSFLSSCGEAPPPAPRFPTEAELDKTIKKLAEGTLLEDGRKPIRPFEDHGALPLPPLPPFPIPSFPSNSLPYTILDPKIHLAQEIGPIEPPPCQHLEYLKGRSISFERDLKTDLASCFQEILLPAQVLKAGIEDFKFYLHAQDSSLFSLLTWDGTVRLLPFAQSPFDSPQPPIVRTLRKDFKNEDLDHLIKLSQRRKAFLEKAQRQIFQVLDEYEFALKPLVNIPWLHGLWILREKANDQDLVGTLKELNDFVNSEGVPQDDVYLSYTFATLLYPYGFLGFVPEQGQVDIDFKKQNHYLAISNAYLQELAGDPIVRQLEVEIYKKIRDSDGPSPYFQANPVHDSVGVALIDTGVDFKSHASLSQFLYIDSTPDPTRVRSYDYSDGDENPWSTDLPGSALSHGTGTLSVFLSVIAFQTPSLLKANKFDIAMWKVASLRGLLSSLTSMEESWENHPDRYLELIKDQLQGNSRLPQFVSVSMALPIWKDLEKSDNKNLLKEVPWVWVMAAGNHSEDVKGTGQSKFPPCFQDVPEEYRPKENLVCVGSLKKDITDYRFAKYSNFGSAVDIFMFDEALQRYCPSGTSCATPALTGGMAILAAKFPTLTPIQIKEVILETAEKATLTVDYTSALDLAFEFQKRAEGVVQNVSVFDTTSFETMERAVANAKLKVGLKDLTQARK